VLFALLLPLILILSVIVVDVGNWYVHARRLQTMVDASAFAGGTKFVGCSFQFGDPDAANGAINAMALNYAGDTVRDPATRNLQVQEPADVRIVLNSDRYWADNDPLNGWAWTTPRTRTGMAPATLVTSAPSTSRAPTTTRRSCLAFYRW